MYFQCMEKFHIFQVVMVSIGCHIPCVIVVDVARCVSKGIPYRWSFTCQGIFTCSLFCLLFTGMFKFANVIYKPFLLEHPQWS